VGGIKSRFTGVPEFVKLFKPLGPPERSEAVWASTQIQVRTHVKRGEDPTLIAYSVGTEITGVHADRIKCDDIVGQKNVSTIEQRTKVREKVQNLESVRDPGSFFTDIGTIWADDDAHKEYIRRDGHSYDMSSFIVSTIRQADGSPLWPEKFTEKEIKRIEKKHAGDMYFFYCQYYNQPFAAATRTFKPEWIKYYDDPPELFAKQNKLSIFITCDPATSTKKKADSSACVVQGQDDLGNRYLLDGFRDHLSPEELPRALAAIIIKWQDLARMAGTSFRVGIETFGFQEYISTALRDILRRRGTSANVEALSHNYKSKADRISVLAGPYSIGQVFWPRSMTRASVREPGKTYDLVEILKDEYLRFTAHNTGPHDDLMDAQAYGEFFMRPADMREGESVTIPSKQPGAYVRERAVTAQDEANVGGRYFEADQSRYSRGASHRPMYQPRLLTRSSWRD
jgi:hypothetical protein